MTLSNIALAGFTSSANRGFKVPSSSNLAPLGDIDKNGIDDFGIVTTGVLTVVWGQNGGFNTDFDVTNIVTPTQGIKITSSQISSQLKTNINYFVGTSFAAKDLNNDTLPEIIIVNGAQNAFIVWGTGSNMTSNVDLTTPSAAFTKFTSPLNCPFGNTLAIIDYDKNGWPDIAFSSPLASTLHKGAVYVMLNQLNAFNGANITMSTLNSTTVPQMITIANGQDDDQIGIVLANLDDVTGDGYPELGIGCPLATTGGLSTGKAFVIKGTATPSDINLANLNLAQGSLLTGSQDASGFGHSMTALKDFNQDGFKDFAVGSLKASPINSRGDSGRVDVIYGQNGSIPNINFFSNPPANLFSKFIGDYVDIQCGASLGLMVNPNGTPIMLIGCPTQQSTSVNFAQIKVVVGANGTYPTTDLLDLADPYGFSITGPSRGDHSGYAVGSLGYITNGTYPSYYVATAIGAFVLNGFDTTSPTIAPPTTTPPTTISPTTTPYSTSANSPSGTTTASPTSASSMLDSNFGLWYTALVTLALGSDFITASSIFAAGIAVKEGGQYIIASLNDDVSPLVDPIVDLS